MTATRGASFFAIYLSPFDRNCGNSTSKSAAAEYLQTNYWWAPNFLTNGEFSGFQSINYICKLKNISSSIVFLTKHYGLQTTGSQQTILLVQKLHSTEWVSRDGANNFLYKKKEINYSDFLYQEQLCLQKQHLQLVPENTESQEKTRWG